MTGRKKSVSRQKSGGRQKPTARTKSGAIKKTPAKASPKVRRDKEGYVSFKSKRDAIQISSAYDPDYNFAYSEEVPIFAHPGARSPPSIKVDGKEYVDAYMPHSHLDTAFNDVAFLYRIGYDAAVIKLTEVPDDGGRYAVYRSIDHGTFKLKPHVDNIAKKLRDIVHTGGWSTETNGMFMDAGRGPERMFFRDKLGQLFLDVNEDANVESFDIAGRLYDGHTGRSRSEAAAFIEINWSKPIRESYVVKSLTAKDLNEVIALNIHTSVQDVFGDDAVYVESVGLDDPTRGTMLLKVANKMEPGHALYRGDYRYGALRDIRKKHM